MNYLSFSPHRPALTRGSSGFNPQAKLSSLTSVRRQVYLGLVLLESSNTKDKAEGKAILLKATTGKIPYFADWAKRELAKAAG